MRIGEVAAATDVSHRSLRHYERAGPLRSNVNRTPIAPIRNPFSTEC